MAREDLVLLEALQVGARREEFRARAGDDRRVHRAVGVERADQRLEGAQALGRKGVGGRVVEGDEGGVAADLVADHGCFMYCRITLEKSLPPLPSTECFW